MIVAGIDAGSRMIKIVVLDGVSRRVLAHGTCDQGVDPAQRIEALFVGLVDELGISRREVAAVTATGYARHAAGFASGAVTEITCHARGVRHAVGDARSVIDIGGQDSKVIRLNGDGTVREFVMNDRCAGGSGRFLELVAARFGVEVRELGRMAAGSQAVTPINSMCAVFAETEIVGLLASNAGASSIAAGVEAAVARRVASMAGPGLGAPVVFTGGVALVPGMPEALAAAMGTPVITPETPLLTGAIGAALIAADSASA